MCLQRFVTLPLPGRILRAEIEKILAAAVAAPLPQGKASRIVRHQMIERIRTAQLLMTVKSSCGGTARRIMQQLLTEWERMRLLVQCHELLQDLQKDSPNIKSSLFDQRNPRKKWWNTVRELAN